RLVDLSIDKAAAAIDLDIDGEREPIDLRIERTDAVGKTLWQHRNCAAGKVHRCPALECLAVEDALLAHVMRDVRDVDTEKIVSIRKRTDFDCVVEVFGGLAVDRDDVAFAEI